MAQPPPTDVHQPLVGQAHRRHAGRIARTHRSMMYGLVVDRGLGGNYSALECISTVLCCPRTTSTAAPACTTVCTWEFLTRMRWTGAICGWTMAPWIYIMLLPCRSRRMRPSHPPPTLPRSGATTTLFGVLAGAALLPMATPLNMPLHPLHTSMKVYDSPRHHSPGTSPYHRLRSLTQPATMGSRRMPMAT